MPHVLPCEPAQAINMAGHEQWYDQSLPFERKNIELQRDWHFESSKLHMVQHKSSISKSHLGLWSVSGTLEILPGVFLIEEPSLSLIECCQLTDNVNVVECTHKGMISYCWIMLRYSLNI